MKCDQDNCDGSVLARGLCAKHYNRWWRRGNLEVDHPRRAICSVCPLPHHGLGYCEKHYRRVKNHGDPHLTRSTLPPLPRDDEFWSQVDRYTAERMRV